ncbi:MAG: nuclear transport factor 2 family protein [Pseudomonadota bacterium]
MIDLDGALALERRVWEALLAGDGAADRALLSEDFLGVYPSGFSDRAGHCGQLAAGPSIAAYEITQARLITLGEGLVLLSYHARYTRAHPGATPETMYVSSIWQRKGATWQNIFSQDTPTNAAE